MNVSKYKWFVSCIVGSTILYSIKVWSWHKQMHVVLVIYDWTTNMAELVPYFTEYKTHFFLRKITSKIHVRLILEINIKMSSAWFKIPDSLKMAIYSMLWETYLYLATLDSTGGSSAQMWRIWVAGIHKLANTVSLPPRIHKQCRVYVVSLQSTK